MGHCSECKHRVFISVFVTPQMIRLEMFKFGQKVHFGVKVKTNRDKNVESVTKVTIYDFTITNTQYFSTCY